jgi:chromosome segregation ATPase
MKQETVEQINVLIRASLPEQVGTELRAVLEEHARQANEIIKLNSHLAGYKESDARLRSDLEKLGIEFHKLQAAAGDLNKREANLRDAMVSMELMLTQRENALLKAERDTYRETLLGFSRNTVVRQKILGEQACVVPTVPNDVDQYGSIRSYGSPAHVERTPVATDTTTQEE